MSVDLHAARSPLAEARGLYKPLFTGSTVEELRALIAVPAKLERALRAYAQANPEDACWVFPALMFRQAVAREFERLVPKGLQSSKCQRLRKRNWTSPRKPTRPRPRDAREGGSRILRGKRLGLQAHSPATVVRADRRDWDG